MLAAQRAWPDWWPAPAWAAALVVLLALSILWPVLLLPLFMKSEPLEDGPLSDALWQTVRSTGVPVRDMRLLHMGEKTSAANAMVAGLGPTLRVYVGDTIGEQADDRDRCHRHPAGARPRARPPRPQRHLAPVRGQRGRRLRWRWPAAGWPCVGWRPTAPAT